MTRVERVQFIDTELKGLWPQWAPTEAEVRVWMGVLTGPDYAAAQRALQQCFCGQAGNYTRPRPGPFLAQLRSLPVPSSSSARQPARDVPARVFLECVDPPPGRPNLAGWRVAVYVRPTSRQDDIDYVRTCAEAMRERFEQTYAGRWITVVARPQPLPT